MDQHSVERGGVSAGVRYQLCAEEAGVICALLLDEHVEHWGYYRTGVNASNVVRE